MSFRLSDLPLGSSLAGSSSLAREPSSSSETFSAEREMASLLGVPSLQNLSAVQRRSLETITGGCLDEVLALAGETEARIFRENLLGLARRLENGEGAEFAQAIYRSLALDPSPFRERVPEGRVRAPYHGHHEENPALANFSLRAQARLDAITGAGDSGPRAEYLLRHLAREATEPTALLGMAAAGAAFRLTRMAVLSRLATTPGPSLLTRPFAARATASVLAFGVEAAVFPTATRLGNVALGRDLDWRWETLSHELIGSFLVLGAMKLTGWAGNSAFRRLSGIRPGVVSPRLQAGQFLVNQASQLAGILLGHGVEESLGLRPHVDGATRFTDSLAMLLQFHAAGRLTHGVMGEGFQRWEREMDAGMERLAAGTASRGRPRAATWGGPYFDIGEGWAPALATAGLSGLGERGTRPRLDLSAPQIFMMEAGSRGEGRRVSPQETLAVLPVGTVTPHGNERTTYQRAVGDQAWVAEVAALNGHVEYRGDGVYADKQSGEILTLEQIVERYGERVRGETGFRELPSDLPIETNWAGQLPTGLRGPEGETEAHLLRIMGLSKREIKTLRFGDSTSYLHGSDQFALQGLYALYRSAVQWGLPLDEIVGHDPRRMGISVGAGLGGMNSLIDLITASTRRRMRGEVPGTTTDPATGPLVLPAVLIDSMQGLLTAVLGPKGAALPPGLTPESVIRTVGRIPVDVGACATGYKAFADAADMFRPAWPGQTSMELAFFGSSEASHGRSFARPEATGFNAMKAMETQERLAKRGGRIEDGYAPLTTDVLGFWPSEGAGVGALMRLSRALTLGLPIDAGVAGYSITGDQGGKNHPAGLGLGGVSSLLESLNMARAWQGLEPRELEYMNLHGTGTPDNNRVEPSNLLTVLDAFGYEGPLRLSAYKALLGHGLGAAGSMEIGLLSLSLRHQLAPGAFNLEGRRLDPNILALGERVIVSADLVRGPLNFVGGQSQGFAGNNGSALFRRIDDATLHEVYGYSVPEIEAYRARLSERLDVARQWEEDIRTGRRTIGEFLSWFGLGESPPPPKPTMVLLTGEGDTAPSSPHSESLPPSPSELLRMMHEGLRANRAPAVLRGMRVDPSQMIVSIGRGQMLTTRGTGRATRSAAMRGIDHPMTLAYLSEDFGLTRYSGRDNAGREKWIRSDNGEFLEPEDISREFGARMLRESGIRELPLAGDAAELPVRHGGLIPEPLRGAERLVERMGLTGSRLKGTAFENQSRNLKYASDMAVYGLFTALWAQTAFGRPLSELFHSTRYGTMQGSAFPGMDRVAEILDRARQGQDSLTYNLQSALSENARGLYLNLMMPHFDFSELRTDPRALERIVPPDLGLDEMPNTGGVNIACNAACASGLYALFAGRGASIRTGLAGEYPMDAFMLMGADATFSPYDTAPMLAGFSRRAPMTVDAILRKLVQQGHIPEEILQRREKDRDRYWREEIPADLRQRAMNESSAPFTGYARGLVGAEGAAAMPWPNFLAAIKAGLWPTARLLGIHVNSGEGGSANLASMDQGIVTATKVAVAQARAHGNAEPQLWQAHGTSTELSNIAEVMSVYQALRSAGVHHPLAVSAIKGLVGHSMGAASAIDLVMGVQSLLDGEAPGLFNFRPEDLDPRYADRVPGALNQFRFSPEPTRGNLENILITSEGFLSADGAAVLGHFPQDGEGAREMLRDYGIPEHVRADWHVKAEENRARAVEMEENLRRTGDFLGFMEAFRFRPRP